MQKKLDPASYDKSSYLCKERWVSYYWQTNLVKDLIGSGKILEVGIGNKLVSDCLSRNYEIKTADINSSLNPDFVASVEDLSFAANGEYDLILCAEVLEHLPWDKFDKSLRELKRAAKKYVIISLPYWGYTFGLRLKLPLLGQKTVKFKINGLKRHRFNGQHYWEIGKKGFPLGLIRKKISDSGLKIVGSFWDLDDPYHYYFVLEKKSL